MHFYKDRTGNIKIVTRFVTFPMYYVLSQE